MNISKNSVVAIHYTLKNDAGEVVDKSDETPLAFLFGAGNIISGLEDALSGKTKGDKLDVSLKPEQAYGLRDDALIQKLPKTQFPDVDEVQVGMQFQASTDDGPMILTVVELDDSEVTVDGNHPMAGETLHFSVEVVEVRTATEEELKHGHVHGAGGHHH